MQRHMMEEFGYQKGQGSKVEKKLVNTHSIEIKERDRISRRG